jgi:hypothetical protein
MSGRSDLDFAIQAPGWNHKQFALHLHHGERGPAGATKALAMASCRQVETPDFVLT